MDVFGPTINMEEQSIYCREKNCGGDPPEKLKSWLIVLERVLTHYAYPYISSRWCRLVDIQNPDSMPVSSFLTSPLLSSNTR